MFWISELRDGIAVSHRANSELAKSIDDINAQLGSQVKSYYPTIENRLTELQMVEKSVTSRLSEFEDWTKDIRHSIDNLWEEKLPKDALKGFDKDLKFVEKRVEDLFVDVERRLTELEVDRLMKVGLHIENRIAKLKGRQSETDALIKGIMEYLGVEADFKPGRVEMREIEDL